MKRNYGKSPDRLNEIVIPWPINASSVDENVFIPDGPYKVVKFTARYAAGSTSGTVTLKKCTTGVAPASGTSISSAVSLSGTANTTYTGTLTDGACGLTSDDVLVLDFSGTMTNLAGGCVTVHLVRN